MAKDKNHTDSSALLRSFTSDLKGRQSVRATFRLTEGCIEAINIVATQLGIKQKSLFDHLAEDTLELQTIARRLQSQATQKQNRIQKTYVISRKTLYSLDEISRSFNAPRDALIEYSVKKLLPIIAREQKKHIARKRILAKIEAHFDLGRQLLAEINGMLGEDDPVFDRFASVMAAYETAKDHMEAFIEKGKILEEFDFEG